MQLTCWTTERPTILRMGWEWLSTFSRRRTSPRHGGDTSTLEGLSFLVSFRAFGWILRTRLTRDSATGALLVVGGQILRSGAMITASSNFAHA